MRNFLIILILLLTSSANAEIIETDDFQDVYKKFSELQQNYKPTEILVLIKVSRVLIQPENPMFYHKQLELKVQKILQGVKPLSNLLYFEDVILTEYKHKLVDANIPKLLNDLIHNGILVMAYTETLTGKFNNIDRLEVWLANYLKGFGLDFSSSFATNKDLELKIPTKYLSAYPVFYNGIINSNTGSLSTIFLQLLLKLNIMPKVLIAVSDDRDKLESLANQLQSFNSDIKFIGFYYTASQQSLDLDIEANTYLNFWYEIAKKLNKIKIPTKVNKDNNSNPYDE